METTEFQAKQHPISFSTPLVQAILEGRKTQTRRIIKPQPDGVTKDSRPYKYKDVEILNEDLTTSITIKDKYVDEIKCPYGEIGDVLWVRESYYQFGKWIYDGITKEGKLKSVFVPADEQVLFEKEFTALGETFNLDVKPNSYRLTAWYKRNSRFMPKKYARLFLQITNIRVERLQDISEEDAIAEGVEIDEANYYKDYSGKYKVNPFANPYYSFRSLWKSINGEESWNANPWVWVIEFEKL